MLSVHGLLNICKTPGFMSILLTKIDLLCVTCFDKLLMQLVTRSLGLNPGQVATRLQYLLLNVVAISIISFFSLTVIVSQIVTLPLALHFSNCKTYIL